MKFLSACEYQPPHRVRRTAAFVVALALIGTPQLGIAKCPVDVVDLALVGERCGDNTQGFQEIDGTWDDGRFGCQGSGDCRRPF